MPLPAACPFQGKNRSSKPQLGAGRAGTLRPRGLGRPGGRAAAGAGGGPGSGCSPAGDDAASLSASLPRQKLAVRSCPAAVLVGSGASGSAKPGGVPALLKAPGGGGSPSGSPGQGLAISVLPAKAPIAMVTAHLNGGLGCSAAEPPQSAPINLQTTAKLVGARQPPELGSNAQVTPGGRGAARCGLRRRGGREGRAGAGPAP